MKPNGLQVDAIQKRLLERVDGVLAVHEFHVWQLAGDRIIASAHIRCRNLSEYMRIAEKVKEFFHNEGIHSTTIQPEFLEIETLYNTTGKFFLDILCKKKLRRTPARRDNLFDCCMILIYRWYFNMFKCEWSS